ncbi:shikimate kinase [Thermohalobacter berrensis]|uniref:Shikimate kinase n=1 Tax=Thermohalobacter berrensis TaxID=99594 RepID=A0A419TAU5_9FIRM|nr:shikimate kinase [Thermohalobacter berrensis]RKD34581.1 hypothetical protein BET03_01780 [Thermohalobacter berrensis]
MTNDWVGDIVVKPNIVLIGFMGTGKTSVGKYLAEITNRKFIDIDIEIEKKNNKKISEIFKLYGEKFFRNEEIKIVKEIYNKKNLIISTGGGIILNNKNIKYLKENGLIFLLNGSIETILMNLEKSSVNRPLLGNEKWERKVKKLLKERNDLYYNSADYVINIDNKTINKVADEVLKIYNCKN